MKNRLVIVLGLTVLLGSCLFAQSVGTVGTVRGKVMDPQGAAIPGATVSVTSPEMQGKKTTSTDAEGGYLFMGLPPGTYELMIERSGFQAYKVPGLLLRPGISLEMNVNLKLAGVSTTVEVTGEAADTPIVDTENPELKFNITGEFINKLPLGTRQQWEQIWFLVPGIETGAAQENFDPTVHGGSSRSNVYKLNGFDIGNAFTNQGWTTQFSTEIIQDVAIKTSGIDASTPLGDGGFINVVTRSGSNKFHGSAAFFAQPRKFNWTNVPGGKPADQSFWMPDLSFGGPIFKDKTWFFASFKRNYVNAGVPRSAAVVASFAANGFPLPSYDRIERSNRLMAKVTHKLNEKNTLSFTYLNDTGWIYNSDSRDQSDQLSTIDYNSGGPAYQVSWTSTLTPTLMFSAQYGYRNIPTLTLGKGGQNPSISIYGNTFLSGGNLQGQNLLLYTGNRSGSAWSSKGNRTHQETTGDLTWVKSGFWGRHTVQTGYQWKPATKAYWDNYYPDSGLAYIFEVKTTLPNGSVSYVPFQRRYYTPTHLIAFNGGTTVVGLYFQDKWTPHPRLTFNLGIRFDKQKSSDVFNVDRFNNWAIGPRLGLAYSLSKSNKDVLRFSWSRVNDLIYTQGAPSAGSESMGYTTQWDNNLDGVWETSITVPPVLSPVYSATSLIDPNIKTSFMDEWHLNYTRQLPGKVVFDSAYVYRDYKQPIGSIDTNIIYQNGQFMGYKDPNYNTISLQTNLTNYHTTYKAIELSLIRNIGAKWTAFANYTYQMGKQTGDWSYDSVYKYLQPATYFDNNQLYRPHIVRLNGSYTLPHNFLVSVIYSIQSGVTNGPVMTTLSATDPSVVKPNTLTLSNGRVVSNPLATTSRYACARSDNSCISRSPLLHIFNLRLGKTFNLSERQKFEFNADLFNVFNKGTPLYWMTSNNTSTNWMKYSSSVQSPRAVELSVRYRF